MRFNIPIKGITSSIANFTKAHGPEVLTGAAIAGLVSTIVFAVKATPKALEDIKEAENKKEAPLTRIEVFKAAWKNYIPTVIGAGITGACMVASTSVSLKRNAALAAAYTISETALSDYKAAAKEVVGEKKERDISAEAAKKKVDDLDDIAAYDTGNGGLLFIDAVFGCSFRSTLQAVNNAAIEINNRLFSNTSQFEIGAWKTQSVNDFYELLGIRNIKAGKNLGWSNDTGTLKTTIVWDENRQAFIIDYPVWDIFGPRTNRIR